MFGHIIGRKIGEEVNPDVFRPEISRSYVHRGMVCQDLRKLDRTGKLLRMIKCTYSIVEGVVPVNGERSTGFEEGKGKEQGSSLISLLFLLLMDRILRNRREREGQWTLVRYMELQPIKVDTVLFAGDIVLMAVEIRYFRKLVRKTSWSRVRKVTIRI